MHGMINKAIQTFAAATYGDAVCEQALVACGVGEQGFEALLHYDDAQTQGFLDALTEGLGKDRGAFLEDLGLFLVANPATESVRRLLRFGGAGFGEFLTSLETLDGRARLALPDLVLPQISVTETASGSFSLTYQWSHHGFSDVVVGLLRAMADDYGALAMIDREGPEVGGRAQIGVALLDTAFADGRGFDLAPVPT